MYEMKKGGRDYYVCDKCGKSYSFKRGGYVATGMTAYCREHGSRFYPPLLSKKVQREIKKFRRDEA